MLVLLMELVASVILIERPFKWIGYPKLSNFQFCFFMLKMKLHVCRNLCENFRQIGQKMKKL